MLAFYPILIKNIETEIVIPFSIKHTLVYFNLLNGLYKHSLQSDWLITPLVNQSKRNTSNKIDASVVFKQLQ